MYLGDTPIATIKNGTAYYIYADQIDTPRVITDTNNLMVWRWDQTDPFGATLPDENPASLGAFTYNLRFPGQIYDQETGKHYNANRDYDPAGGRYIQSDPIGLNGGQWSTYSYVGGQPTRYTDPKGLLLPALLIPLIGGSISLGDVAIGTLLAGLLMTSGDTQGPRTPDVMSYAPGYRPGSWPPPPPAPPTDKPESWPDGDDWRGQCIRLYAQCQRDKWTGNCGACLNKCTAQKEWPFQGPGACRPRKKNSNNSCPAF